MANFTIDLSQYNTAVDGKVRGTDPGGVYVANLPANSIYIDNTLTADITDGSYSIASRNNTGTDGNAYTTIQAAINAAIVGDTLLMRGGTYSEYNIVIPNTHRGTAWTAGNYYHLTNYPGEYVICDGGNIDDAIFTHAAGFGEYQKRNYTNQTQYWKFSNFEVTRASASFWFSGGPIWWSHVYMHDCISQTIDLSGAIWVTMPQDCIVEYCWFKDNNQSNPSSNQQFGHIVWDADYRDDELPTTFDPNQCTKRNTIRYNHFDGSLWAIHYKNMQRFGTDTRVPATVASTYGTWGDLIHHNFVQNCSFMGILVEQDNAQVYNNIIDQRGYGNNYGGIQLGYEIQASSATPVPYNSTAYNNTILGGGKGVGMNSGVDPNNNTTLYGWVLNNISTENEGGYFEYPFVFAGDITSGYSADLTEVYLQNNLSHSNISAYDVYVGYLNEYTTATAEVAYSSFTNNDSSANAGLFIGATGSDQYVTNSTYVFKASTLGAGGLGGAHPYLVGVTLPSYIGAVNPASTAWVSGVYNDVANISWLTTQTTDPTWIET